ncbi:alpha/beta hydrolase family protein [Actinocorallia lasiicapitis]
MRRLAWIMALLVVAGCSDGAAEPAPTEIDSPPAVAAITAKRTEGRLDSLVVASPALGRSLKVWVLRPEGWTPESKGWPVLYLLHPCCGAADGWIGQGGLVETAAKLKAVVFVPEADPMGWYSDWVDGPAWETFHLKELGGLLEPVYGVSGRRAVAGASMGGFGAFSYAARNPGLFQAAASFSGALHPDGDRPGFTAFLNGHGTDPAKLWGDDWAAHDPTELAAELRGVDLYVSSGNGLRPGPLDQPGATSPNDSEIPVLAQSRAFTAAAAKAGVKVRTDFYGDGFHRWPYWKRALARALPVLFPN